MPERIGARDAAAEAVAGVLGGRSLGDLLPPLVARLDPRERGLAQELTYGTVRFAPRLTLLLPRLLDKPLKAKDRDIEALLLVGLYQLSALAVPAHAAVHETVQASTRLGKGWARGLINAVLRRYQREADRLGRSIDTSLEGRTAHPRWLLERLERDWPGEAEAVATANNARPPMTLRVNRQQASRSQYAAHLVAAGLTARPHRHVPTALTLDDPVPVERLPGFGSGAASVQDAAAQLAAELLDPQPGERILDACAAPGGKTGHLLERAPSAAVTALDRDPRRLTRVTANLERLGLPARVVTGDAADPAPWWDGSPFDRILLDAPCSGTGVIRRHPDIKLLRRPEDIPALADTQARLLRALWPLLRPGGMLVYATCSVFRDENDRQVVRFLDETRDAQAPPIAADWGRAVEVGRQILPGDDDMDGFYYARLVKR